MRETKMRTSLETRRSDLDWIWLHRRYTVKNPQYLRRQRQRKRKNHQIRRADHNNTKEASSRQTRRKENTFSPMLNVNGQIIEVETKKGGFGL